MTLSIEVAVRSLLLASSSLSAVVGVRIAPGSVSEQTAMPYIVYNRFASDHQNHMQGASGLVFARIQLDLFAETWAHIEAMTEAIRNRIDGYRGTVTVNSQTLRIQQAHLEGVRDNYIAPTDGSDNGTYSRMLDFFVSASETIPTLT